MPTKKPKTTITVEPRIAEALDKLAAIRGYSDRDAFAQSILQAYLRPAVDRSFQETFPKRVITASDIAIRSDVESYLLRVRLVEHGMPSQVRKSLEIQTVSSSWNEQEQIKTPFRFPFSQVARARTVLLPWLDQALAEAETAHREEARQNRLAAQEERKARTPEQVEAEAITRREFIDLYNKERWRYAVEQATRHRARARRRKLTEHFTAADWLTLADRQGFECAECRKPHATEHLQSHHIRALMHEGKNTIDNIILLCATCHLIVEKRGENYAEEWFALEQAKMGLFAPGDPVSWYEAIGARRAERGEVSEVIAPKRGEGPLWCLRMKKEHTRHMWGASEFLIDGDWRLQPPYQLLTDDGKDHNGFAPTRLRVCWKNKKGAVRENIVRSAQIVKIVVTEPTRDEP